MLYNWLHKTIHLNTAIAAYEAAVKLTPNNRHSRLSPTINSVQLTLLNVKHSFHFTSSNRWKCLLFDNMFSMQYCLVDPAGTMRFSSLVNVFPISRYAKRTNILKIRVVEKNLTRHAARESVIYIVAPAVQSERAGRCSWC